MNGRCARTGAKEPPKHAKRVDEWNRERARLGGLRQVVHLPKGSCHGQEAGTEEAKRNCNGCFLSSGVVLWQPPHMEEQPADHHHERGLHDLRGVEGGKAAADAAPIDPSREAGVDDGVNEGEGAKNEEEGTEGELREELREEERHEEAVHEGEADGDEPRADEDGGVGPAREAQQRAANRLMLWRA